MVDENHLKVLEIKVKYKVARKTSLNSIDLLLVLSEIPCHLQ